MRIIYPPRPQGKISPTQLPTLEKRQKYVAQRKFRGARNLIHRSTKGEISMYSRHGRKHLRYKMPSELKKELSALNFEKGEEYWLDSELMDPRIPHVVILFDVLQAGKYLYGVSQMERLDLLRKICNNPQSHSEPDISLCVSKHVWLAEHWTVGFSQRFEEALTNDLIEGLVLREKESILDNWGVSEYEIAWQLRVRKPGPNYQV